MGAENRARAAQKAAAAKGPPPPEGGRSPLPEGATAHLQASAASIIPQAQSVTRAGRRPTTRKVAAKPPAKAPALSQKYAEEAGRSRVSAAKDAPESQQAGASSRNGAARVSRSPGRLPGGVRSFETRMRSAQRGAAAANCGRRLSPASGGPPPEPRKLPAPVHRSQAARARLKVSS